MVVWLFKFFMVGVMIVSPVNDVRAAMGQAFPYLFMRRNGKQQTFHDMHNFINILAAANKLGKTAEGAVKFIEAMKDRKIRARIVSDPFLLKSATIPEVLKWLGEEAMAWKIRKDGRNFYSYFEAPNGSVADVLTYEQQPKEHEGVALDYLWMDEPPPHRIWGACLARFLTPDDFFSDGEINLTMTPLWGAAHVYDNLIKGADDEGSDVSYLYGDIEDNCIEHGVNGLLSHAKIQKIIAQYDEEEKQARIHGLFGFLLGRVWKVLDPNIHWVDPFSPPAGSRFFQINDPHDRRYPAVSFAFMTPKGQIFIYDEFPNEPFEGLKNCPMTIADVVKVLKRREAVQEGKEFFRIMDPNFARLRSAQTGRTTMQEYSRQGMSYHLGKNDMALGHDAVRTLLKNERLFIFRNCRNHWHFLNRYGWKDLKGVAADTMSISEKVETKFKDFCDNMRYLAVSDLSLVQGAEEKARVVPDPYRALLTKKRVHVGVERTNDVRVLGF